MFWIKNMSKFKKIFRLMGLIAISLFASQEVAYAKPANKKTVASKKAWQPPEGYSYLKNGAGIAFGYKWLDNDEYDCRFADYCWGVEIVMSRNCPTSLYVAAKFLDEKGKNIGWTNDTAMGVEKNEPVVLIFEDTEGNSADAAMTQLSCY